MERSLSLAYSCCWQGVRSDVARWEAEQLALVRLGVANVRWACAAPRLATHRKQMPIAANVRCYMLNRPTQINELLKCTLVLFSFCEGSAINKPI